MASPERKPCPVCNDRGLIGGRRGVQYCLCPIGRQAKAFWLSIPEDMREEEERICPTLPDAVKLDGAA